MYLKLSWNSVQNHDQNAILVIAKCLQMCLFSTVRVSMRDVFFISKDLDIKSFIIAKRKLVDFSEILENKTSVILPQTNETRFSTQYFDSVVCLIF